jgi:hypothetical protein
MYHIAVAIQEIRHQKRPVLSDSVPSDFLQPQARVFKLIPTVPRRDKKTRLSSF